MTRALRFGVLCRGSDVAAWEAESVRLLAASGVADCVARVDCRAASRARRRSLLWRLFSRLCRPRALRRQALEAPPKALPRDLDFVLDFSGSDEKPPVEARFGVWAFRFGDTLPSLPAFWEIHDGKPTMHARLERVSYGKLPPFVMREGCLKTIDYHYARSVDQLCFEAAKWPSYVAAEIAGGLGTVDGKPQNPQIQRDRLPSNIAVFRLFARWTANIARRVYERGLAEEWNVGAVRMLPEQLLAGARIEEVCWQPPLRSGWTADPMALRANGKVHVLCEEMSWRTGKGQISVTTFDGTSWSKPSRVIETPTHASYPYLFEHRKEIYCVPETYEANEIALYRAREFPLRWQRVATLMDGIAAIDGTLFEHDGRYWLFCTTSENSNAVLRAFYAPELLGPWRAHARNPVKIDVRASRPAGPTFRLNGQLFRPAQDSSRTYGGRIVIHRVVTLTPTEFAEEAVTCVEPRRDSPYGRGVHTLCFAGEYCILDGKRLVRRRLI
jgi:hypothetical protein